MKLSLIDKSSYYKGLLVLSGRDRIIHASERELMLEIGKKLDFDRRFCAAAIDELLINTHITKEPIIFSDPTLADCFLRDAVRLAQVDGDLHPMELRWLRRVAHANGRTYRWLDAVIRDFKIGPLDRSVPLEVEQYL